ncbi:hypothetical protein NWP22_09860 [Anabaenopsis tanganyikae CS-531]|uniref:Uncharacterized protein n=2 Tax=Anabaenopsis TaxID=110103 RepID=A0ABT6KE68_9CYAN|nr:MULTISPECIES: hypothetical protein [Anabaenopsis]MDB9541100.1 hypothetical protein [Anabaenopsis arnoldii]MDH6093539.1 hypothetical protein [Anabaenopsis arnoldii]MDH6106168.1 hypothetical protein [Anabaenopsis tanganyikae CS-531]
MNSYPHTAGAIVIHTGEPVHGFPHIRYSRYLSTHRSQSMGFHTLGIVDIYPHTGAGE